MSYFDPPDKDTGIPDRSPWGKSTHPMSGKREAELLRAREWIDAESSANEGRTTPAGATTIPAHAMRGTSREEK
jgi:hypothetical protein